MPGEWDVVSHESDPWAVVNPNETAQQKAARIQANMQQQMKQSSAVAQQNIAQYPKPWGFGDAAKYAVNHAPGAIADVAKGAWNRASDASGANQALQNAQSDAPLSDKLLNVGKQAISGNPLLPVGFGQGLGQNAGYTLAAKDRGDVPGMVIGAGATLDPMASGATSIYENAKQNPGPASVGYGMPDVAMNAVALGNPSFGGGEKPPSPSPVASLASVIAEKPKPGMNVLDAAAAPAVDAIREVGKKTGVTGDAIRNAGRKGPQMVLDTLDKTIDAHNDYSDLVTNVAGRKTPVDAAGLADRIRQAAAQEFNDHVKGSMNDWADKIEGKVKDLGDLADQKKDLNKTTAATQKKIAANQTSDVINDLRHEGDMKVLSLTRDELYRTLQDRTGVDMGTVGRQEGAVIHTRDMMNRVANEVLNQEAVKSGKTMMERARSNPPTSIAGGKAAAAASLTQKMIGMEPLDLFNSRMARVFDGPPAQGSVFPTITAPNIAGRLGAGAIPMGAPPADMTPGAPAVNPMNLQSTTAMRKGLLLNAPPIELPGEVQSPNTPPVLTRQGGAMAESGQAFRGGKSTPAIPHGMEHLIRDDSPLMRTIREMERKRR